MSTDIHCGPEGAVDSVLAALEHSTAGLASVLAEIRAEQSLTTAELEDVRVFTAWGDVPTSATAGTSMQFPYLTVISEGSQMVDGWTQGKRRGVSQVEVLLWVLGRNQDGRMGKTRLACARYYSAITRMLSQRRPNGGALFGGSGNGAGRIERVDEVAGSWDSADARLSPANLVIRVTMNVYTVED